MSGRYPIPLDTLIPRGELAVDGVGKSGGFIQVKLWRDARTQLEVMHLRAFKAGREVEIQIGSTELRALYMLLGLGLAPDQGSSPPVEAPAGPAPTFTQEGMF